MTKERRKSTACQLQKFGKQARYSDGEVQFQVFEGALAEASATKKPAE